MNEDADIKILLIGLANSSYGDNAVGKFFVSMVESLGYEFLDCKYRTQLHPEDAKLVSEYDLVFFVNRSGESITDGFEIKRCFAATHAFYSSDVQAPAAILHLTNKLYKKVPKAYLISISGDECEHQAALSNEAECNLQTAIEYFNEQFLPSVLAVTV